MNRIKTLIKITGENAAARLTLAAAFFVWITS